MKKSKRYLQFNLSIFLTILSILSCLGATYAWFTFSGAYTEQTPLTGSVSPGDMVLSISQTRDGKYGEECDITRLDQCQVLSPVSTYDLENFYRGIAQNRDGKMFLYEQVQEDLLERVLYGEVYLKAEYQSGKLYFDSEKFQITGDAQLLAGARLGIRFSDSQSKEQYIFDLEQYAKYSQGTLTEKTTIEADLGNVVSAIDQKGSATFQKEVSQQITSYSAIVDRETTASPLFAITSGDIVKVEIWLYMEGCDPHCINEAQQSLVNMNLAFTAIETE